MLFLVFGNFRFGRGASADGFGIEEFRALGYVFQARGLSILRMKPAQGLLGPKLLRRFTLEDPHDLGIRKHVPEPVPSHTGLQSVLLS